MSNRRAEAGFTLFEVLVAAALFALILGSFGALFFRLERTNAAISRMEAEENVDVVRRFLRQSIESSRARLEEGAAGAVHFTGEPSRIVVTGLAAEDRETGGIYETEIRLAPDGRLLLFRRPLGWGGTAPAAPEVLLRNLAALSFTYLPCPPQQPAKDPHRWTDAQHLPFMVLVTARFAAGDTREWRDLAAFPPAAACAGAP